MNDSFVTFLFGLAAAWQIIVIFLTVLVGAVLQKFIAKLIASKFMNIQISGTILWSCILGIILGSFASGIILESGGGIISLAIYLLATYPFFPNMGKKIC